MNKLIRCIIKKISETNSHFTDLELKKMEYGLLCLFDEVTKIIPYYIIFYLFSLQHYYVVVFMFFCPIRLFSGGYHSKTYWGCFFISLVNYWLIIFIGKYIMINAIISIIVLAGSVLLVCIFSPVDNINKRIKSEKRRKKLKYFSVVTTFLLSVLCYLVPDRFFTTAVISILAAVVMMMIGYIINMYDKNYIFKNNELK
jgi:accessory gene regulator B